ncbi:MAG: hypothetical protein RL260_1929 [Pseudomonadota bacterium]|jgi:hypothetical protein
MAAGSTPRGQDSPDDRDTLAAALEERSRQLDARLRETRCLFEVSASLGDYGLSCAQAAQVVAVCLPMAFERPEIVQIRVALDDGHAGDDMPAAGWHLSQPVQRDGVRIGCIDLACFDPDAVLPGAHLPDPSLLQALARELSRWFERRTAADLLRRSEASPSSSIVLTSSPP